MKLVTAVLLGIASGVAAVFLYQLLPPIGIILATVGTFISIWSLGRRYGKRRYKLVATIAWAGIFIRAATFGSGKEIFIQGDNLGNAFLFTSFIALAFAVALPAN